MNQSKISPFNWIWQNSVCLGSVGYLAHCSLYNHYRSLVRLIVGRCGTSPRFSYFTNSVHYLYSQNHLIMSDEATKTTITSNLHLGDQQQSVKWRDSGKLLSNLRGEGGALPTLCIVRWSAADFTWGCCQEVEGFLWGPPESHWFILKWMCQWNILIPCFFPKIWVVLILDLNIWKQSEWSKKTANSCSNDQVFGYIMSSFVCLSCLQQTQTCPYAQQIHWCGSMLAICTLIYVLI